MPTRLALRLSLQLQLFPLLLITLTVATNQEQPSVQSSYSTWGFPHRHVFPNSNAQLRVNNHQHCGHLRNSIFEFDIPDYANKTQLHKVSREELKKFEAFFDNELPLQFFDQVPVIRNRMNGNPEDIELCDSASRVVHPERGQTLDSGWQYILQTGEHKQGVLEEYCDKEDEACRFTENFPNNYVSRCKQYYSYRTMVAINNGVPSKKEFLMRSACKCVLRVNEPVSLG